MYSAESVSVRAWRASLGLRFERRGARSVLALRRQDGPLVVQRPLYPEGDAVCQVMVVHPPAGVAGGDELDIDIQAGPGAHAQLTTPGAGKWYRSAGPWAQQRVAFAVAPGACIEWLPQETIVYDGVLGSLSTEVRLADDARYIGWDIVSLGRSASGERFRRGMLRLSTSVWRERRLLWKEAGVIEGGSRLLESPAGLGGRPITGTLVAAAPGIGDALLAACRGIGPGSGDGAVTRLPELLVARYVGDSSEAARRYFCELWRMLRPALMGLEAVEPRVWRT